MSTVNLWHVPYFSVSNTGLATLNFTKWGSRNFTHYFISTFPFIRNKTTPFLHIPHKYTAFRVLNHFHWPRHDTLLTTTYHVDTSSDATLHVTSLMWPATSPFLMWPDTSCWHLLTNHSSTVTIQTTTQGIHTRHLHWTAIPMPLHARPIICLPT